MKILIVKTSSLGDIVHAFDAVGFLRDTYPDAVIDWVVEESFADLVRQNPDVTRAIPVASRRWKKSPSLREMKQFFRALRQENYDVVFDLQGNSKSGVITALAKSPRKIGFGRHSVRESLNCLFTNERYDYPAGQNVRNDLLFLVQQFTGDVKIAVRRRHLLRGVAAQPKSGVKTVVVAPGSAWPNKELSFDTLLAYLQSLSCRLIITYGSERERKMADRLQERVPAVVVGNLTFTALQQLMVDADLFIGMDSFPLHLAGAAGVPTLSFFGPTSAHVYGPIGSVAYQGPCPYGQSFDRRCPILRSCPTGACLKDVSLQDLLKVNVGLDKSDRLINL